ncbi:MAG: hypothetical protein AAF411_17970, partial [Myxococcota bacterium]
VCGDLDDSNIDAVRVFITGTRSPDELLTAVAQPEEGEENVSLPTTIDIPRLVGPGLVSVEARAEGRLVARYTHRVPELADLEGAAFPLNESCRMFDCPFAETCVDGECVGVRPPSETRCP